MGVVHNEHLFDDLHVPRKRCNVSDNSQLTSSHLHSCMTATTTDLQVWWIALPKAHTSGSTLARAAVAQLARRDLACWEVIQHGDEPCSSRQGLPKEESPLVKATVNRISWRSPNWTNQKTSLEVPGPIKLFCEAAERKACRSHSGKQISRTAPPQPGTGNVHERRLALHCVSGEFAADDSQNV